MTVLVQFDAKDNGILAFKDSLGNPFSRLPFIGADTQEADNADIFREGNAFNPDRMPFNPHTP